MIDPFAGPWSSSPQTGAKTPLIGCWRAQVWDAEGKSLADLDATEDPAVASARAVAIAALPDLIKAARRCVSSVLAEHMHIAGRDDDYIYDVLGVEMSDAYFDARRALAKAGLL